MSPGIAVAIVPEEYYRKPKGVQFRKSFIKREEAVNYAETNGCRVVIACEAGSRYDVLYEPCSVPTSRISFVLVVDRGEMMAVPRLTPPSGEVADLRAPSTSGSAQPSFKWAWNSVYSWLNA